MCGQTWSDWKTDRGLLAMFGSVWIAERRYDNDQRIFISV